MTALASNGGGSAAIVTARCNPFGHETGGPKHLMGGVYDASYEGPQKWHCENPAAVRARMMCERGHKGQVMNLCRSHAIEIQRRQSDLCPPCAWPEAAVQLNEAMNFVQREISALIQEGSAFINQGAIVRASEMQALTKQLEGYQERMTELYRSGVIQKNPLTLTEIS
jgi:hypothetical protein